jgi:hypothetical protein
MQQKQVFWIQIIADLAIPLLGFLVWDWSLFFIFAFYVLDYLVSFGVLFAKHRKIKFYRNDKQLYLKSILRSVFIAVVVLVIGFQFFHFFDSFSISQELFFFLSYEELGIPQGAILIPLLVLGGYQQFTTFFVKTGAFRVVTLKQLWNNQFKQEVIILAAAAFVFGVSHFFLFPSEIYVVLLIISVTAFRIWKRKIE